MVDPSKKPLLQVTNLEFYAGLMSLAFWSTLILATFALHPLAPLLVEVLAAGLLVLTSTWMYRGRHHFGRLEARGHFDEVGLMELGPRSGDVLLWDPPTVIEHTKEEKQEDLERNKQLAQEFSYEANLNDNSKPKIILLDDSSDGKSENSDDFKKKRHKHYDNEYAAALRKAKEAEKNKSSGSSKDKGFKNKRDEHYANEFALANEKLKQMQREREKKKATLEDPKNAEKDVNKKSDDFKSKRDKHYENEFLAARETLKSAAMEDRSDAQPSKKTQLGESQNSEDSKPNDDKEKANTDREEHDEVDEK